MALLSVIVAIALASQPLAIWSSSDTSLGQELQQAFERAVGASSKFQPVISPQGDAPSLLVEKMQFVGEDVSFSVRVFAGLPHRSDEIWSFSETCPREELDRCAADVVERLPDFSER